MSEMWRARRWSYALSASPLTLAVVSCFLLSSLRPRPVTAEESTLDRDRAAVGLGPPPGFFEGGEPTSQRKEAEKISGQLGLRSYLSTDDSDAPTPPYFSISFLEADLHAQGLGRTDVSLHLDATFLLDIQEANERRFGETERFDQVRQLYLEQALGALTLRAGRRLIAEAGNGWVDGAELSLALLQRRLKLGAYGGFAPDPFDRSFGVDRQGFGLYSAYQRRGLQLTGAWHGEQLDGTLDRHYFHQRAHWMVTDALSLSSYLILDLIDEPTLSTFLATADYRLNKALTLSLNLSRYSLARYRNQQVYRNVIELNQLLLLGDEVIDLVYNRARLSASLRISDQLYHYQSLEFKRRAQDGAEAWIYCGGFRLEDTLNSGVELDLRGQVADQFRANDWLIGLSARRNFGYRYSGELRASWLSGRTLDQRSERLRLFDEAHELLLFGASITFRPSRAHQLLLGYDAVFERGLVDARSDENVLIQTGMLLYRWLY
ncbi:MAG: hypothetical protein VYD19_09230 [Myxococcota bacterium]|nr:hypothetical protein [Myxococcota bacterium]